MKKLIAIPLLVLYLVAISGTMVQFHFCGDKLSALNFNLPDASCCCGKTEAPAKGNKMSFVEDDCCSNKTITLKIAQDQNTVHGIFLQLNDLQVAGVPVYVVPVYTRIPEARTRTAYHANAPPGPWQGIPLYKLHSRFTYYG